MRSPLLFLAHTARNPSPECPKCPHESHHNALNPRGRPASCARERERTDEIDAILRRPTPHSSPSGRCGMELPSLVPTNPILDPPNRPPAGADLYTSPTVSPTKHAAARDSTTAAHHAATSAMAAPDLHNGGALSPPAAAAVSPHAATPKTVAFELLFNETPYRARLPLRVSIFPHDTTDSIVTTVKNFYGLYSGPTVSKGVSFEDELGNTLIARYENFRNNMVVYVRVIEENSFAAYPPAQLPPQSYYHADPYPVQAAQVYGQHLSRPGSRASPRRSPSPTSRGRRSASASTNPATSKKGRSRSSKTRGPASQANGDAHSDSLNGYSSGDGEMGSVSGRSKEHIGNTEISVENIVEGGRRKRAKFESSELPLFAPPQMPAATSNASVSPARRVEHHRHSLPFVQPSQNPFTHPRPLQSPQSYTHGYGHAAMYATPAPADRRTRASIGHGPGAATAPGMGLGMMPTPDPTVGSCMSEEDKDVAIQLMRLGDMSNMSHGRTSASTMDDTFSGRADAASSTGATSDAESESEDDAPAARRQRLDASGHHRKVMPTTESHFVASATPHESVEAASGDDVDYDDAPPPPQGSMAAPKLKNAKSKLSAKPRAPKAKSASAAGTKSAKSSSGSKSKKAAAPSMPGPMSPASLPGAPRKPAVSSAHHHYHAAAVMAHGQAADGAGGGGDDQPDLSTKPRCQRCRKSKKGCDRQRPCGRCRDAGLPADMCISEDEGNGRKGRYGRHMGVPVVTGGGGAAATGGPKDGGAGGGAAAGMLPPLPPPPAALLPAAPIAAGLGTGGAFAALGAAAQTHAHAAALAMPAPPVGMGDGGAMGSTGDKGKKRKR